MEPYVSRLVSVCFHYLLGRDQKSAAEQSIRQSTIALVQDLVFFARVYILLYSY